MATDRGRAARLAAARQLLADLAGRGIEPECPWLPLRYFIVAVLERGR